MRIPPMLDQETARQRPGITWRSRTWPVRPLIDIPFEAYDSLECQDFVPPETSKSSGVEMTIRPKQR